MVASMYFLDLVLPSAIIGIPPLVQLSVSQFDFLYQFWVHTCHIRRLGFLEYIIGTPSAHRIHHDRRVHKNFGGVFMIWDIMFGTFADEGYDSGFLGSDNKNEVVELEDEVCYYGTSAFPTTISESVHQSFGWVNLVKQWWSVGISIRGPGWNSCVRPRQLPKESSVLRLRGYEIESYFMAVYGVVQTQLAVASMVTTVLIPDICMRHALLVWTTLLAHGLAYDKNYRTIGLCFEIIRLLTVSFMFYDSDVVVEQVIQKVAMASIPFAVKLLFDGPQSELKKSE